jgi:RNA 3'-terminal phosphate cyclase (ATP)
MTSTHASDWITIDGSQGEGGGQVLRTSLALSLLTGRPFAISKIRAGRRKPGLLRQHHAAVAAAARVGRAETDGAELGSTHLRFRPSAVEAGDSTFSIGIAGSATLVLQTVLPALLLADAPSRLTLEGGTHNPFAPPFDFLERTLLPLLGRMGAKVEAKLERPGFYPAGGGRLSVAVTPCPRLDPLELLDRGAVRRVSAVARVAGGLPTSIADRELREVSRRLSIGRDDLRVESVTDSAGPGNVLLVDVESDALTEVFSGFGTRGVSAEAVAGSVADEVEGYLRSEGPVGVHLADQLLVPMAVAGGGEFRTPPPTLHTITNVGVVRVFLDTPIRMEEESPRTWRVEVG